MKAQLKVLGSAQIIWGGIALIFAFPIARLIWENQSNLVSNDLMSPSASRGYFLVAVMILLSFGLAFFNILQGALAIRGRIDQSWKKFALWLQFVTLIYPVFLWLVIKESLQFDYLWLLIFPAAIFLLLLQIKFKKK